MVGPAVKIIRAFLSEDERLMPNLAGMIGTSVNSTERDLWTQYVCKVCNSLPRKCICFLGVCVPYYLSVRTWSSDENLLTIIQILVLATCWFIGLWRQGS